MSKIYKYIDGMVQWFQRITEPHESVREITERKAAQFIAGFHLLTLPLGPIAVLVQSYTRPNGVGVTFAWSIFPASIALLNYLLARSRWFYISIHIQIWASFAVVYYTAILIPDRQSIHFAFLIPIFLSGILLSLRTMLYVSCVVGGALVTLFWWYTPEDEPMLMGSLFVGSTLIILILYMRYHQNTLEDLRNEQLRLQQQQFLALFDASFDGTTLIKDNRLFQVSDGFASLFGFTPEQLENTAIGEKLPAYLFDRVQSMEMKIFQLQDGSRRHLQMVYERSNKDTAIVAVRDVTEQQESQTKTMMMDRVTSTAALAVGIAHEMNSPLMIAMNNLQRGLDELRTVSVSATLRPRFETTQEMLERMADILNDIKWFVSPTESLTVSPNSVIEHTVRLANHRISHLTSITLRLNPVGRISIPENRFGQAILNLLFNAAEAKKDSQSECAIDIETGMLDDNTVEIVITDNGKGMSSRMKERIFEPFFTTKSMGTGLGLAICHQMVSEAGGSIQVESTPDNGSAFRLHFPVSEVEHRETSVNVSEEISEMILIIDDDRDLREVLVEMLPTYQTRCAGSIQEALNVLEKESVQVIICDVIMPNQGAIDLYSILRERDEPLAGKMLFITGGVTDVSMQRFIVEEGISVLHKPFSYSTLQENLHRLFQSSA